MSDVTWLDKLLEPFRRATVETDERYRRRCRLLVVGVGERALREGGEEEFERRIKELYVEGRISVDDLDWAMAEVLRYWRRDGSRYWRNGSM